jgi:hypothetical protein
LRSSSSLQSKSKIHTTIAAGLTKQMLIYTFHISLAQFGLTPKYGDDADIKFHDRGASDHG